MANIFASSIAFSVSKDSGWYIPLHAEQKDGNYLFIEDVMVLLKDIFEYLL